MSESDTIFLRDMLLYARDAVRFAGGKTRDSLDEDLMFARALIYTTGIVGEAAFNVSREFQVTNPQILWPQIIGMRNRLFHGYGDVNYDRLWTTVQMAIPELIVELEKLIPPEKGE
jgi:uncharacterized protein with HEPN domain